MKVRFATLNDIDATVEMGRGVFIETRYKVYDYDVERVALTLRGIVESEKGAHCLFVATNSKEKIIGCLIGCVERHIFSDKLAASVIIFAVLPEHRMGGAGLKLLTAFKKWAENRGAFEITAGVSSGVDLGKMDRFLCKLGFQHTGGNYSMQLGVK